MLTALGGLAGCGGRCVREDRRRLPVFHALDEKPEGERELADHRGQEDDDAQDVFVVGVIAEQDCAKLSSM